MTNAILTGLKSSGHRLTVARRAIAEILEVKGSPMSAADIHAELKRKKLTTNIVTVYRELQFLTDKNMVHAIAFKDGVQRFEPKSDTHKHHLICTGCNAIQHVEMDHDLDHVESKIRQQKSFDVHSHSLEFYGLCSSCKH
jgi:Fur family ferric uptake transcriptional regulator